MTKPTINIEDLEFAHELRHGEKFEAKIAPVGVRLGAQKLSYNLTVVPPGKRAFPFHNHHINEEFFFIVEGEGTLRYGEQEHALRQGDFVACPVGGPELAHQIINTGVSELRYVALSTTLDSDIFQYPDSDKFGVVAGREPGKPPQAARFGGFYRQAEGLDYWDGE